MKRRMGIAVFIIAVVLLMAGLFQAGITEGAEQQTITYAPACGQGTLPNGDILSFSGATVNATYQDNQGWNQMELVSATIWTLTKVKDVDHTTIIDVTVNPDGFLGRELHVKVLQISPCSEIGIAVAEPSGILDKVGELNPNSEKPDWQKFPQGICGWVKLPNGDFEPIQGEEFYFRSHRGQYDAILINGRIIPIRTFRLGWCS